MLVYAVVSEMLHDVSYEPPSEEWGRLAVIVAARSRGQARYLAVKSDRGLRNYGPLDWPRLWCKRLGEADLPVGVVEDSSWWEKCGDWEPEKPPASEPLGGEDYVGAKR